MAQPDSGMLRFQCREATCLFEIIRNASLEGERQTILQRLRLATWRDIYTDRECISRIATLAINYVVVISNRKLRIKVVIL